jgi:hypothetical protein
MLLLPDDHEGHLRIDGVPLSVEDLADEAAITLDEARSGLEYFASLGMVELEGNLYRVTNFRRYQVSPEAERKRLQRKREAERLSESEDRGTEDRGTEDRDSGDSHVTCHGTSPPPDTLVSIPCEDGDYHLSTTRRTALETEYPTVDVAAVAEDMARKRRAGARPRRSIQETDSELARWVVQEGKSGGNRPKPQVGEQQPGEPDPWPEEDDRHTEHPRFREYVDFCYETNDGPIQGFDFLAYLSRFPHTPEPASVS